MRLDYNFSMRSCCCFLLLLLSPTLVYAGDLTLFAGFQKPGELSLDPAVFPGQIVDAFSNPTDSGVFGARINPGSGPIGLEHTLAFTPRFIDSESKGFIYNSNLLIQIPALPVRPYGTVGAGLIHSSGNTAGVFGTSFAINYGGGVKISISGPVGIRIDVRGYTAPSVQDDTLHIFESSIGVVFGF